MCCWVCGVACAWCALLIGLSVIASACVERVNYIGTPMVVIFMPSDLFIPVLVGVTRCGVGWFVLT